MFVWGQGPCMFAGGDMRPQKSVRLKWLSASIGRPGIWKLIHVFTKEGLHKAHEHGVKPSSNRQHVMPLQITGPSCKLERHEVGCKLHHHSTLKEGSLFFFSIFLLLIWSPKDSRTCILFWSRYSVFEFRAFSQTQTSCAAQVQCYSYCYWYCSCSC